MSDNHDVRFVVDVKWREGAGYTDAEIQDELPMVWIVDEEAWTRDPELEDDAYVWLEMVIARGMIERKGNAETDS